MHTWQPLIGILEPSKFKEIWKFNISHEIWTFHIRYSHFALSCEIIRWAVTTCWNIFWTISHDHAKSTYIFLSLQPLFIFWFISHNHAKFLHDHANIQHLVFKLPFVISSISFFWFHLNYLQFVQMSVQTNCITSFIMYLDHHQHYLFFSIWFISFVTNLSNLYLEMTPKLHKTCLVTLTRTTTC